jgi:hypothetical protein
LDRRRHSQRRQIGQIQAVDGPRSTLPCTTAPRWLADFPADYADIAADKRLCPQFDIAAQGSD